MRLSVSSHLRHINNDMLLAFLGDRTSGRKNSQCRAWDAPGDDGERPAAIDSTAFGPDKV